MSQGSKDVPSAQALALCLDHVREEVEAAGFFEASLLLDLAILSIRSSTRQALAGTGLRH